MAPVPDITAQKAALRSTMRAALGAVSSEDARLWSGEIGSLLFARLASVRRVMLYWPIHAGSREVPMVEPDLRALVSSLLGSGVEVTLPRTDWASGNIEPRIVRQPHQELVPGRHGLSEPAPTCASPTRAPDVVVVPGLAFDGTGARLGRGAGFYDRFLGSLRQEHPGKALIIGVAFGLQIVERVPVEPGDQAVDEVWTERARL
jgi:5-formyltetrahydrofolate cyclo-ligase